MSRFDRLEELKNKLSKIEAPKKQEPKKKSAKKKADKKIDLNDDSNVDKKEVEVVKEIVEAE